MSTFERKQRLSVRVAGNLIALTIVEFIIAVTFDSGPVWIYLLPAMAAKGWLIMSYFMHVRQINQGDH